MNLLIVDDEAVAIKGMMDGVDWKSCGIDGSIWTAYSAETALRILNMQQVDIMLCDIEMPGINGLDLLRVIRKENKELVCIFLTCHANFEYAQEAITLGCKDYILKPAPYEIIEEKLKKVCEEFNKRNSILEHTQYNIDEISDTLDGKKKAGNAKNIVQEVEKYVREHMKESELLVSDIADALFLNKDYLNRVFKKAHGISISQYLIQERMNLAGVLLRDPRYTINMVAEQVGYNNYPYFASSFKHYYNCTPSQYQKKYL